MFDQFSLDMLLRNFRLNVMMKLCRRICFFIMLTWGLYLTVFLYKSYFTRQNVWTKSNITSYKFARLHKVISREEATLSISVANATETNTKSFYSDTKVKIRLHNVKRAGNETIPVHRNLDNEIPAEIRMRKEDNERHYFTLHKERINPIEVDFIINGAQICSSNAKYMTILVMVPSLPSHSTVRHAIRATYGSYVKHRFTLSKGNVEVTVRLAFLVGKDNTIDSDPNIRSESRQHGDIIYADFVEAYQNLTRKMLIALKWVSVFCSDLDFFLKIDEDVFINMPLLARELNKRPYSIKGSVYGYLYNQSPVYRKGKWAVTKDEYPMVQYPKYAAGNSYVISGNIIPRMFVISEYMPHMPIEDVFITGCIAKIVEAKHVFMPGFAYWHEEELNACKFMRNKRISTTKVSVDKMFKLWNASINFADYCKMQFERH
ncbi:Beta-1 [Mactra antiquata]